MSIAKVAEAAGVSHGTVSRMINGRGGVSPTTARRIQEAIDRLGYQPRPVHARPGRKPAAAGVRTGNVCLLLVGASRGLLERPGIHTLVTSIEETLRVGC